MKKRTLIIVLFLDIMFVLSYWNIFGGNAWTVGETIEGVTLTKIQDRSLVPNAWENRRTPACYFSIAPNEEQQSNGVTSINKGRHGYGLMKLRGNFTIVIVRIWINENHIRYRRWN